MRGWAISEVAPTAVTTELLRHRLEALSLPQKVRLLTGADFWSLYPEPAAGLERLVVSDGPAGVRGEAWDERDPSANVPSPTALAASWDEARVERLGRLLAGECHRKGVHVLLAPTVNLHRTPYGGRHFECLSEDRLLTGRIGAAYIRGVQGGGVGATVKHFVANDSETERFTLDARIDERALRELYLAPFEHIVKSAQPWAAMAAYNGVNGATMTENPMLAEVLKAEWGFDGVVMSDWYAARTTVPAARAGLDLVMPGPAGPWSGALVAAVQSGEVAEAAVDAKVLRLLRLAARVGVLDGVARAAPKVEPYAPAAIAAELRACAAAGFVLLHNEPVAGEALLPLAAPGLLRVAVLGPNAEHGRTLGGGSATVFPPYTVSPLAGLAAALGPGVELTHSPGVRVGTRLPVAEPAMLRLPDGSAEGVEVRFLAPDGSVLGSELRRAAALRWLGPRIGPVAAADVATAQMRTRLRAGDAGEHRVGCSGVGHYQLSIAGRVVIDEQMELDPAKDPVEAMMAPPQRSVPVSLSAGDEVELVLSYRLRSAGTSAFGVEATSIQLNVETPHGPDAEEIERAAALARDADVAVVVVGTSEEVESEGIDRTTLALPGLQDELVRWVAAANPRTVVVVNSGAPVLMPWAADVPAVLLTWFPGQEFGHALADVLLGIVEPGGRLPTTWPAGDVESLPSTRPVHGVLDYSESIHIGHRRFLRDGVEPAYWFGHGLGYTTWDYLDADVVRADDAGTCAVRVRLRNTGPRAGREVVQVYASRPRSGVERPVRWLVGFAAAMAEAGAEAVVTVRLERRQFEHWDASGGRWVLEGGAFDLAVGRSVADLPLNLSLEPA
ncbi:MAG: glycoside hydrolase family 3 C-terminal domain-containing protein [Candidatus Dormibacteraeota bacterium]|nr:glycoside hydrolase family 3 C-terminal domain-containing protein [Candidatus Dormibacteraeota bacterium]